MREEVKKAIKITLVKNVANLCYFRIRFNLRLLNFC